MGQRRITPSLSNRGSPSSYHRLLDGSSGITPKYAGGGETVQRCNCEQVCICLSQRGASRIRDGIDRSERAASLLLYEIRSELAGLSSSLCTPNAVGDVSSTVRATAAGGNGSTDDRARIEVVRKAAAEWVAGEVFPPQSLQWWSAVVLAMRDSPPSGTHFCGVEGVLVIDKGRDGPTLAR